MQHQPQTAVVFGTGSAPFLPLPQIGHHSAYSHDPHFLHFWSLLQFFLIRLLSQLVMQAGRLQRAIDSEQGETGELFIDSKLPGFGLHSGSYFVFSLFQGSG